MADERQADAVADSWTRDERAKARRLADVKRGTKTRRQFQTLTESTLPHRIPFPVHDGTTFSFSATDTRVGTLKVQDFGTTAPLLRSVSEGVYKADNKGNKLERAGPLTESTRRYSVLISGGTLSKQAPYMDRVKPELVKTDVSEIPPSKMDRLQHSDSVDQSRDATTVPAPGHGRHLRSRKELFAFQQDLLLPRYRKLAGISENVSGNASVNTSGQSIGGKGGSPDPEESNGTQRLGANQRTEEVFEKVRLIIRGPTKEAPKKDSQNNGKRRQAMPIYLKSGLPCGYVDPSSKCDAWLDANDFNE
ncbi:uncharacterized protein [Diadema setosum]|uniref:uncharacterized protein n=1 Tax=Diadema setosum TaxID=31175 RepID=UPI003B3B1C47